VKILFKFLAFSFSCFAIAAQSSITPIHPVDDELSFIKEKTPNNANSSKYQTPDFGLTFPKRYAKKGAYVNTSFIYWQSKVGELEYCSRNNAGEFHPFLWFKRSLISDAKIVEPKFDWKPGFKVELGYLSEYDNWDIISTWTYIYGRFDNQSKTMSSEWGVDPLWYIPHIGQINHMLFSRAKASWKMQLNVIDLCWGRNSTLTDSLSIRLFAGAKGAWYKNKLNVKYNDSEDFLYDVGEGVNVQFTSWEEIVHPHQDSWGIGPQIGINSLWKLFKGFHISADSSFSVPYFFDNLKIISRERIQAYGIPLLTIDGIFYPTTNIRNSFSQFRPICNISLGLAWESCFDQSSLSKFYASLQYELQYWWNFNQMKRALELDSFAPSLRNMQGDLQTQGLTASIGLEF